MTPLTPAIIAELWDQAAAAETGIAIPSDDQRLLASRLKEARKLSKNPAHKGIRLCNMGNGEVWLVKETVEVIDDASPT